jgi:cobalt-zinc-cadmium efflux system membrane fusion protein
VGDQVPRGAVVAHLHSHVVHDAWAEYFKAIAELRRVEAELAYTRTNEARAAQLVADRALSPQELERARTDVSAASQAVVAARAEITRFEQELDHYGIKASPDANPVAQSEVPVRAPIAGTVIERLATEGMAVTPGTPLLVISDLSRVWVMVEIDEQLIGRVTKGREATIKAGAYGGESFTGTLTAIGDVVNPATRRVTLRIEAPNPDRRLKPQMFVAVSLGAASPRRVLVVPSRAVQAMEGEQIVFVRTADNRFERRAVTAGTEIGGEVEIVSGLHEGEVVATAGAFLLKSELMKPARDEEP